MLWLALDCSSNSGSIALEQDGKLLYQCYFNIDITHSETLMPQLDTAMKFCGLKPEDLSGIITTIGPGSFTGLRIGLATAKGLAYARKIPLLTYSTLELIAANCYCCANPILVCLDAKMQELYTALYSPKLEPILAPCVLKPADLVSRLEEDVFLVGNMNERIKPLLEAKGLQVYKGLEHQNFPMAAGLFSLRRLKPQSEIYDIQLLAELEPQYLRASTAQVKLKEKQNQ
ncbi:MAG: tRNA (adenosine(37)-N6)-threonylcarbamoyltransferase complex dimerization subunit type 1 TsaB [Candidatus Cloacimonadaceae bacterium]